MSASPWQEATVTAVRPETTTAVTIGLRPTTPFDHRPGQHVVVRLTAPDGYTASRSYSIATPAQPDGEIELTVERLPEGEVSSFLHDDLIVGDVLEIRGPIGGYFVWTAEAPAVLVGGGSGVVPLMAMLRHARRTGYQQVRLVVSVRTPDDLYYADELPGPEVTIAHTRTAPVGAGRIAGRLALDDVRSAVLTDATAFVCGSSGFADAAAGLLMQSGVPVDRIRIERFGASG
jgi:ferredoxin-NADP reductase